MMATTTTVLDHFTDRDEFDEVLENAQSYTKNDREGDFVQRVADNYEKYGIQMFLSADQARWLKDIASRGEDE
jgi:hypothetical protein